MTRRTSIAAIAALLLVGIADAADPPGVSGSTGARYTLKQISAEPAPQRSSRYAIKARFSEVESAGGLHEGRNFALIGKFAKGGESCSAFALFSNGFE